MNALSDFHLIRPAWLFLAPVAVWTWWRFLPLQDPLRGWRAVMDPELLDVMTVGDETSYQHKHHWLLAFWLIGLVAVAGPTWHPEPSPFADDPIPVMVVLAASETMDLTDLSPNRMERAQLKIADLTEERKGQPMGLIAYAGSAHLVLPPTRDTGVVSTMAAEISPAVMPKPGDDLVAALRLAATTLHDSGGSIVVVTDSVRSVDTSQLETFNRENRTPVSFLAIARADTPEWDSIRQAASSVNGDVTLMTADSSDIDEIVKLTANVPRAVSSAGEGTRWAESGWWLVPVLALIVLTGFRRTENDAVRGASA